METVVPAQQEWQWSLPIQQQTVLLAALRGPDGIPKYHPCKVIARAYRSCVIKAAFLARAQHAGDVGDAFMDHQVLISTEWQTHADAYFRNVDEMPHHYHLHLLHAAEILGYKHPDLIIRSLWLDFYISGVEDMHLTIETEDEMDRRLNDFGRLDA